MSRRAGTAWDAAALRWSTLYGHDSLPSYEQIPSLRPVYGVRNVPLEFSLDLNHSNPETSGKAKSLDGSNVASSSAQALDTPRKTKQNLPLDLAFQTMVLRHDILFSNLALQKSSGKTGLRRKRQRVVDGAIERCSAYWSSKRSRNLARGPMRARVPLVGRDLERLLAYSHRTSCLRTDRGTTRRAMAMEARESTASHFADPMLGTKSVHDPLDISEADPSSHDANTERSGRHPSILPTVFPWTRQDEHNYWTDKFGWAFADQRSTLIPDASMLTAMHYYVGKFYETRGQLPASTCSATADSGDSNISEDQDEMIVGDSNWDFWAQYSIGAARSMLQAFDSSALVALATYLEEYTKAGTFPSHAPHYAETPIEEHRESHSAALQQDEFTEPRKKSSQSSSKAWRAALKIEHIKASTHRKRIPRAWLEKVD